MADYSSEHDDSQLACTDSTDMHGTLQPLTMIYSRSVLYYSLCPALRSERRTDAFLHL